MDYETQYIYVVHTTPTPTGIDQDFIAFASNAPYVVVTGRTEAEAIGKLVLAGDLGIHVNRICDPASLTEEQQPPIRGKRK